MKYFIAVLSLGLMSCGYHVAGKANLLPSTVHTIAIPAFGNLTARYKLTDVLPQALSREFLTRTRYKVVSDPNQADVILRGSVINFSFNPTVFDPATNRAAYADLRITLQLKLEERATGKVLYSRPNMDIHENYGISTDAANYFDQSDEALKRASERVATQVVTAILENF